MMKNLLSLIFVALVLGSFGAYIGLAGTVSSYPTCQNEVGCVLESYFHVPEQVIVIHGSPTNSSQTVVPVILIEHPGATIQVYVLYSQVFSLFYSQIYVTNHTMPVLEKSSGLFSESSPSAWVLPRGGVAPIGFSELGSVSWNNTANTIVKYSITSTKNSVGYYGIGFPYSNCYPFPPLVVGISSIELNASKFADYGILHSCPAGYYVPSMIVAISGTDVSVVSETVALYP